MMELKVWVDGLQRVVCGVTTETTCQDVVIALAHAMGRTGRFTLIEKWRDVERPLTPGEYPLRVLHKWGEYATEVRLLLCESNVDRHKQRDRHKQPDKFTHNFSPPKTLSDNSVKRNLTFSGAHNTSTRLGHTTHLIRPGVDNRVSPRSSTHSSSSSVRSSPRPVPAPRQGSPANLTRVPPRHSPLLNGQVPSLLPNKTNIVRPIPSRTNILPGGQSSVRQNIPPPRYNSPNPQSYNSSSPRQQSPSPLRRHSPLTDLSKVTPVEHTLDTPFHERQPSSELEEYDLDMNFPDILRDSKQANRPAAHTEYKLEESPESQPESEHTRLLRLVAQQTERLKVQESQLDVLETEIVSLEQKENEFQQNLKVLTDDLVQLEQREHEDETELSDLSNVEWVEVVEKEQNEEKKLKTNVSDLHVKISDLDKRLSSQRTRMTELEADVTKARKEREEKEREVERKKIEKEEETKKEQKKVQEELNRSKEMEQKETKELDDVVKEISEIEKSLQSKQESYANLEEDLKKVNLEDFGSKSLTPPLGKSADSGEAVLKILEGRLSPRPSNTPPSSTQPPFVSALASKNPNGVWV